MLDRQLGLHTTASNDRIQAVLKELSAAAAEGRWQYFSAIWSENPTHHQIRHCGARGLEHTQIAGAEVLKLSLIEQMTSAHMQQPDDGSAEDPQAVGYDLTEGPSCFDFLCWLVINDMRRRRHGVPGPLKVGFRMKQSVEEKGVFDQLRKQMYEKVMIPAVPLIGGVIDPDSAMRPSLARYTFAPVVDAARRGEYVPRLSASDEAMAAVKDYVGEHSPPVVTITLRESGYWEHRNSNLPEWQKVAAHLQERGYRVVFVRDTKLASEEIEGFESCPSAAFDLDVRLALYESAFANLFVSNGPWYLALLGSKPWLMFIQLESMSPFFPETPQFWAQYHGIDPMQGEQFPWQTEHQRIVPGRDFAHVIIPAWDKLEHKLSQAQPSSLVTDDTVAVARS